MNFKDLLIDSAIKSGIEILKEIGEGRKKSKMVPPKRYRPKKKQGNK